MIVHRSGLGYVVSRLGYRCMCMAVKRAVERLSCSPASVATDQHLSTDNIFVG